jgi:D-3-phosphoglycerate dehydrogenase / 2-oxoglutarate reductase
MPTRVLITDHPFDDIEPEREVLGPLRVELDIASAPDEASILSSLHEVRGILVCYAHITAPIIQAAAAGGCRIISRYGIGYDNVDVEAATRAGIVVTTVPDYCLDEVADHTLALLLSHARAVVVGNASVRRGAWVLPDQPVHRLTNRRLALIGLGAIGRRVADRAAGFGLGITVFDPYADRSQLDGVRWVDRIDEAVADADFISLHVPLTEETRHIIDANVFSAMANAPLLINTARGALVDLDAAAHALAHDRLGGLALDVTEPEPLNADHPILEDARVIVTPHTAFHSQESQLELQRRAAEEVARALRGELPQNPRNLQALTNASP